MVRGAAHTAYNPNSNTIDIEDNSNSDLFRELKAATGPSDNNPGLMQTDIIESRQSCMT